MVDASMVVPIGNALAAPAWLLLAASLFVPRLRPAATAIARFAIPALFALAYVPLAATGLGHAEGGGFATAAQIRVLFANDSALAAGWLHYLAFDLFVGSWIAALGRDAAIPALLLLPCLILTWLFGPAGLLLFLILRLTFRGRVQPEKAS